MKLPRQKRDEVSATITQTLCLVLICFAFCVLTAYATDPAWWSTRGAIHAPVVTTNDGVVTTNYVPNPYAAVTQGQVKQFTARAVDELNARLGSYGGAGTNLTGLVTGWSNDYYTNGYSATNLEPSDYDAMTVGQLKWIAGKVYGQLSAAGYTELYPSWIHQNTNTDNLAAAMGQLKQVFDFDLSLPGASGLTAMNSGSGTIDLNWTLPSTNNAISWLVEEQNTNGTWNVLTNLPSSTANSYAVTGLTNGTSYTFQVIASGSNSVSLPVSVTGTTSLVPLTGMAAWYRADLGVSYVDGQVLWADQTGNYPVESNGGATPTVVTNAINGLPAIGFNGSQCLLNYGTMALNAGITMIAVSSTSNPGAQQYQAFLGNETTQACRGIGYASSAELSDYWSTYVYGAAVPDANTFVTEATTLDSTRTQVNFYRNGAQTVATQTVTGIQNVSPMITIGACDGYPSGWQGEIAEVLIYDHQLSSYEMDQVDIYLATKYNLPVTVSAPVIAPGGDYFNSSVNVTIAPVPSSAEIVHYTLDGSTPISTSPIYTGPFTISSSTLVQAAVFLNGNIISPLSSVQYYTENPGETALPIAPSGLTATSISAGENDLSWELTDTVSFSAVNIYRSTNGGAYVLVAVLDPTATGYDDLNVIPGDSYTYEVGTINASGISDTSASSSVTPPTSTTLTITVTTPSGAVALP